MSIADRLLVGSVLALAGFVFRDQLLGSPTGKRAGRGAAESRARVPSAADTVQARQEYAALTGGLPFGAEPPLWLRDLHVGRLLAGSVAAEGEGEGQSTPGAAASAVERAAEGAGTRTYLREMIREQDSTIMRWHPRAAPLRVWVKPVRRTPADSLGEATAYVQAAFRVWNEAATGVGFTIVADSSIADVHVTWASSLGRSASRGFPATAGGEVQVGHTVRFADAGGWVLAAHVVLAESGDLASVQNAALHEAGHVLGLGHSSQRGDQMAAITDGRHFALTDADRATARALYTLPPGRVRGGE